jgi:hypothetical protein
MFSESASGRDGEYGDEKQERHQRKQQPDQQSGAEKDKQQRIKRAKTGASASFLHQKNHLLRIRVVPSYAGSADPVTNSFFAAYISLRDCRDWRGKRWRKEDWLFFWRC